MKAPNTKVSGLSLLHPSLFDNLRKLERFYSEECDKERPGPFVVHDPFVVHGRGKAGIKPAPRHAELAVNLAGTLSVYLIATWEARNQTTPKRLAVSGIR